MKVFLINPPRENEIIGNNKHIAVLVLLTDLPIKRSKSFQAVDGF